MCDVCVNLRQNIEFTSLNQMSNVSHMWGIFQMERYWYTQNLDVVDIQYFKVNHF